MPEPLVFNTPILLLIFNRLDTTKQVLETLRKLQPRKVYIASDGARDHIQGEAEKVSEIREYALSSIDWGCEVETFFREENLGCKYAVHEAVQWFFSQEEKGIILEDDIVPSLNFFKFCEKALEMFKDDKSVGSITGRNELQEWGDSGCFMASRFQCWGWASWSDRMLGMNVEYGYDKSMDYSRLYKNTMWEERCYLDSVLGLLQTKQVNSWAYAYDLNFKKNQQLQIYPQLNLVQNIGFGEMGTHSTSRLSDAVVVFDEFSPFCPKLPVEDDKNYIKNKLRTEYGGVIQLSLMRYIRYFKRLRKLKKMASKFVS